MREFFPLAEVLVQPITNFFFLGGSLQLRSLPGGISIFERNLVCVVPRPML